MRSAGFVLLYLPCSQWIYMRLESAVLHNIAWRISAYRWELVNWGHGQPAERLRATGLERI